MLLCTHLFFIQSETLKGITSLIQLSLGLLYSHLAWDSGILPACRITSKFDISPQKKKKNLYPPLIFVIYTSVPVRTMGNPLNHGGDR